MIPPEELMLKALREALDEIGLAPNGDDDDARDLVEALAERGYQIVKGDPQVVDQAAPEEE